jgi:hypothetical protein
MKSNDPVDALLGEAFRRDFERTVAPSVAARVVRRVRARQRVRGALLGAAAAAGALLIAADLLPLLNGLVAGMPELDLTSPALLMLLAALGAGSMLVLAEESL